MMIMYTPLSKRKKLINIKKHCQCNGNELMSCAFCGALMHSFSIFMFDYNIVWKSYWSSKSKGLCIIVIWLYFKLVLVHSTIINAQLVQY